MNKTKKINKINNFVQLNNTRHNYAENLIFFSQEKKFFNHLKN